MALFHYSSRIRSGTSRPFVPTLATQAVGSVQALRLTTDTIIRTRMFPRFTATVDTSNLPLVADWWSQVAVEVGADFPDAPTDIVPNLEGTSKHIILTGQLRVTPAASQTTSGFYSVVWEGPAEGFQSSSQRRGVGTPGILPRVRPLFRVYDPTGTLGPNQGLFGVLTYFDVYTTTLWGSAQGP